MEQNGGGGTKINELMENITNNQLDDKESTMVDSIINDLNNSPPPQQQQQQQQQGPPAQQQQMNDKQMQQQMMMQQQQQMEQYQQILQQQQTELEKVKGKKEKKKKEKESDILQEIITHIKLPLIVVCLSVLLNIDPINEIFKFGNHPIFFDVENNKFTITSIIIRALLIGVIFFGINFAINK